MMRTEVVPKSTEFMDQNMSRNKRLRMRKATVDGAEQRPTIKLVCGDRPTMRVNFHAAKIRHQEHIIIHTEKVRRNITMQRRSLPLWRVCVSGTSTCWVYVSLVFYLWRVCISSTSTYYTYYDRESKVVTRKSWSFGIGTV